MNDSLPPASRKIRTIIAEDEPLAQERLLAWLRQEPGLEVVGQPANGREAVEMVKREKPDLLFLDVQMPELDGFGVLAALGEEVKPVVVFVTAYDQFAVQAFTVHAVDYLLKPFDHERFRTALRRALARIQQQEDGTWRQQLSALLAELRPEEKRPDRLAIKAEGRVIFLKTADIDWIEAADNYVKIHSGAEAHLLRETMGSLEERLASPQFLRISRSAIVNVDRIKELQPLFHGEYVLLLRNGTRLTLSRNYRDRLAQLGL
jgi:two-component system, LytTR family, response regulator